MVAYGSLARVLHIKGTMEPFPGILKRSKKGYHPITLDREQKRWLRAIYPTTENRVVEKAMGITHPTLYRIVREMNLKKSAEGLQAIKQRAADAHARRNKHERLRMMSGLEQTKCGNIRMRAYTKKQSHCRHRAVTIHNYIIYPARVMKENDPDRWKIFYDDETQRSARFEKTCQRYGLEIEEYKEL